MMQIRRKWFDYIQLHTSNYLRNSVIDWSLEELERLVFLYRNDVGDFTFTKYHTVEFIGLKTHFMSEGCSDELCCF